MGQKTLQMRSTQHSQQMHKTYLQIGMIRVLSCSLPASHHERHAAPASCSWFGLECRRPGHCLLAFLLALLLFPLMSFMRSRCSCPVISMRLLLPGDLNLWCFSLLLLLLMALLNQRLHLQSPYNPPACIIEGAGHLHLHALHRLHYLPVRHNHHSFTYITIHELDVHAASHMARCAVVET